MTLPIDRTAKTALDGNLVNGNTSDAPKLKASNDIVYNTIDELNTKVDTHSSAATLAHPDGSVITSKIADGAVTTPKIADGAITSPKIANGAVGPMQLQTGLSTTADTQAQFNKRGLDVTIAPYNAKGDGVADDTAAIRAAISAVPQHGKLFFPPGIYRITDTITNLVTVYKAFDWIGSSAGSFIYLDINDTTKNGIEIHKVDEINVSDITVIGKANSCKNAVMFDLLMRSSVRNLTVLAGAAQYGVSITNSYVNDINIKMPNSLITGTDQSDTISGKWAIAANGVYFSQITATRLKLLIEGVNGDGLVSDNVAAASLNVHVTGTIEGVKGHGLNLSYITNLTIQNLYEEANGTNITDGVYDIISNCTNIDVSNVNNHYGTIKYVSCSNINSRLLDQQNGVTGATNYDDSTASVITATELETNTNTTIEPMRDLRNKPIFLAYPMMDRFNASNQPIENLRYKNSNAYIGSGTVSTTDILNGTNSSFAVPQTNFNQPKVDIDLSSLLGRTVYATVIFKKQNPNNLPNPHYDFCFYLNNGATVRSKSVYFSALGSGWNRVTLALKISESLTNCSFQIVGYPQDTVNYLPIEIGYLAITLDAPSYSPYDYDGHVFRKGYSFNGKYKVQPQAGLTVPTTGDWIQGDQMPNTTPAASGSMGIVCTTSGTPGTWKTFGTISA